MNYIYGNEVEMNKLLNRFIRYVKVWSESDEKKADEGKMPSTEQQWDLARMLVKELRNLGTRNVYLTDFCYVVAKIDSNGILFCALCAEGVPALPERAEPVGQSADHR